MFSLEKVKSLIDVAQGKYRESHEGIIVCIFYSDSGAVEMKFIWGDSSGAISPGNLDFGVFFRHIYLSWGYWPMQAGFALLDS